MIITNEMYKEIGLPNWDSIYQKLFDRDMTPLEVFDRHDEGTLWEYYPIDDRIEIILHVLSKDQLIEFMARICDQCGDEYAGKGIRDGKADQTLVNRLYRPGSEHPKNHTSMKRIVVIGAVIAAWAEPEGSRRAVVYNFMTSLKQHNYAAVHFIIRDAIAAIK